MTTIILLALKRASIKLIGAMCAERLLLWSMVQLGEALVAKTTSKRDDKWLANVKAQLEKDGHL